MMIVYMKMHWMASLTYSYVLYSIPKLQADSDVVFVTVKVLLESMGSKDGGL